MKCKLSELLGAEEALVVLMKAKLPARSAFLVGVFLRNIEVEVKAGHEVRLAVFRKYGEERDGQVFVPPKNAAEFNAELAPFLDTEVMLKTEPLPLAIFDGAFQMTAEHMRALMPFIDVESEKNQGAKK